MQDGDPVHYSWVAIDIQLTIISLKNRLTEENH